MTYEGNNEMTFKKEKSKPPICESDSDWLPPVWSSHSSVAFKPVAFSLSSQTYVKSRGCCGDSRCFCHHYRGMFYVLCVNQAVVDEILKLIHGGVLALTLLCLRKSQRVGSLATLSLENGSDSWGQNGNQPCYGRPRLLNYNQTHISSFIFVKILFLLEAQLCHA